MRTREATLTVDGRPIRMHVTAFPSALQIWVGADASLSNLAVAHPAPPAATAVLGGDPEAFDVLAAKRMAKRFGIPVHLSINVPDAVVEELVEVERGVILEVKSFLAEEGDGRE